MRDQVAHTIIVGFADQTRREIAHDIRRVNGSMIRFLGKGEAVQLRIRGPVGAAVRALRRDPGVHFAEVVRRVGSATAASDSSSFGQQWSLRNTGQFARSIVASDIDAMQAWQLVGAGSREVLVGSVDSGVAFSLPALAGLNLWTNTGEVVGGTSDGADDDDSFCVDDVYGCDFVNEDGDPTDDDGHGTATVDVMMGPWALARPPGSRPA